MTRLKSPAEIRVMREAGRIVAQCHAELAQRVQPGVSTEALDQFVEGLIREKGATPSFKGHEGFPATICVAVNDVICHGIPGPYRLQEGDVVTIDIGARYQGYHGDSAWTYAVGRVAPEVHQLMAACRAALFAGIAQAQAGKRLGEIGHAIQSLAESQGYGVVREFIGHGVGQNLWENPPVPHVGQPNTGRVIRTGLTIAIEPMLTAGGWQATMDADGWTARTADGSLCVQYEHTIAVTDDGPTILTEL